ncbi:thiol reductant ABC exporter subunit CydC [Aidingimonas lacisalsi]|uniref:thiol reductant ABC exporter subunit CydC n=1 Tax=Aidingimonas lacisalsi TaxID=2604086 RepID=UPI001F026362|nr:thiol reductant ABC exporter subunit CydC [Aidingimonas lacisalsi]
MSRDAFKAQRGRVRESVTELAPWLRLLSRHRARLSAGAMLMLLTVGSAIGLLALSGWFITATAVAGSLLAVGGAVTLDVYVPGGGIRLFAVTRTVARYLERVYNHDTVLRLLAELRAGMFAVLSRLDGYTLSRRRASEWLNRLTADIDTLDSLYLRLMAPPVVALVAIGLVSLLSAVFVPSAVFPLTVVLLASWLWLVVGQAGLGMAASQHRVVAQDRMRSRVIEHLQGLAELTAYGALQHHHEGIDALESALYRDQRCLAALSALGNALVSAVIGGTSLMALFLAAQAYHMASVSAPVMVMLPLAVLALNEALAGLPMAFTQLGATRAAARRLNGLGRSRGMILEPESPRQPQGVPPAIRLTQVTLHYPDALLPALQQVDLHIEPGERVALLGASGAGKSSVAQLIARLIDPQRGSVRIGGVDARNLSLDDWRARLGYLTQQAELFHDSIAFNLRLGASDADDASLWDALAMVELDAWVTQLPHGLSTTVGEGGRQLSGGQARRLALARLLLMDPEVVILDEPFAGLDGGLAARISLRLDHWLEGRSTLFLMHQLDGGPFDPPGIQRCLTIRDSHLITAREAQQLGVDGC